MTRRKSVCSKWTLVLLIVLVCPFVNSRPQEVVTSTTSVQSEKPTESPSRDTPLQVAVEAQDKIKSADDEPSSTSAPDSARLVKIKAPIRDSIQQVASQLIDSPHNVTIESVSVVDKKPVQKKSQVNKQKIKMRNEDTEERPEFAHTGEAFPVTMEELETETSVKDITKEPTNESTTAWVLVTTAQNNNVTASTEPTKIVEITKKPKPASNKTKNKTQNKTKRPIIGSTNKSDLIAGGSAINENVYNKLKETVLSNVQKNKSPTQRTTTTTTIASTTVPQFTEALTTVKEVSKAPSSTPAVTKVKEVSKVSKTKKKHKNKNKTKIGTVEPPVINSASLPMEAKEQEIELEVSTPPTTTKKPKRSSNKKKTKTKKRKTTKPKPETSLELKAANKTKTANPGKKPAPAAGAISSQIYNYLSREVMPSVGVGMLGLASLVGIAGYFLYPFSTPLRRTFEVDKKDDLYRFNAEEYASEGNGQAEEEMLGTVLAGMPAHAKQKLNPYAAQTPQVQNAGYPVKKETDLRYRQVAANYKPAYNPRYPQQKTGIAHAAVYSKPVNYNYGYETRNVYTTEGKFNFDKLPTYAPYASVEPIYATSQTGPSGSSAITSYGSDSSNSVVYGVKPAADSDFKPVYPFEAQFYSDTTNSPATSYPPTSMYLGSNNDADKADDEFDESDSNDDPEDNKFVVGNVPKELSESATPAVVPEHGPRKISKRSISSSLEEILNAKKNDENIMSNEIDDAYNHTPIRNLAPLTDPLPINSNVLQTPKEVSLGESTTAKNEVVESVSTLPINPSTAQTNDEDPTTKGFKIYEVFSGSDATSSPIKVETTTQIRNMMTETTTELRSETTSTMPPSQATVTIPTSRPTENPDVITYPPLDQSGGFFTFIKRLVEFKYRLGLSILQTTSENLNRYLRNVEGTMQKVAKASHT